MAVSATTTSALTEIAPDTRFGAGSQVESFCVVGQSAPHLAAVSFGDDALLRSHTVVYRGSTFGDGFQTGHGVLVRELTTAGNAVSIGSHSIVEHHVTIGDGVRIHGNCFVPEFSVLDAGAWLGPGVIVTNARYPNRRDTKANLEGVHIGAGATIGAGVVLLPGVSVGAGALIGAGAVVVRDVAPHSRLVGNPARSLP